MQYAGNPTFRIACYREYGFKEPVTGGGYTTISVISDKTVSGLADAIAAVTFDKAKEKIAALSIEEGDTYLILPTTVKGDEVGAGMDSYAETRITWNSTNDNVVSFTENTKASRMKAAVTSPGAIDYKMEHKGAGITKLTATVQAYTKVVSGGNITLKPVPSATMTATYFVTADKDGFTCMIEQRNEQPFTVAVGYAPWNQSGILNVYGAIEEKATKGIPTPAFITSLMDSTVKWTSSKTDVIAADGTAVGAGTATLTADISVSWGQKCTVIYTVEVDSDLKVTYTKVVLE